MSLKARLLRRAIIGLLSLPALLFISAGSLKFWQAWALSSPNHGKGRQGEIRTERQGHKKKHHTCQPAIHFTAVQISVVTTRPIYILLNRTGLGNLLLVQPVPAPPR